MIGAAGGAVLLVTDGVAFGMEMSGNEEEAEKFKKRTEKVRLAATIMTLPDLFYGGYKVVREMKEIREFAAADRTTRRGVIRPCPAYGECTACRPLHADRRAREPPSADTQFVYS